MHNFVFTGRDQTSPERLLAVCLSSYYHGSIDKSLGKAFAEFFTGDEWKNKTINSFCETLEVIIVKCRELHTQIKLSV